MLKKSSQSVFRSSQRTSITLSSVKETSPSFQVMSLFGLLLSELREKVNTLIRLIRRNNLAVASEMVVYKVVCDYIESHPELLADENRSLFEAVRFPFMTFGILDSSFCCS